MSSTLKGRIWLLVCSALLIIIIAGGTVIRLRFPHSQAVEIYPPPLQTSQLNNIIIGGAVSSPGIYTLKTGDTIGSLLQAAGGPLDDADINQIKIYVPRTDEQTGEQKIDLNRAGNWLLEALPGIGKTLSTRIIDYRKKNGPFRNITELTEVKGITSAVFDKVKEYITVSE